MDLRLWLKVTKRGIVKMKGVYCYGGVLLNSDVLEINFQCTSVFN